jgi:hypothetical protein
MPFDIKNLYTNMAILDMIHILENIMEFNETPVTTGKEIINLVNLILTQNYIFRIQQTQI